MPEKPKLDDVGKNLDEALHKMRDLEDRIRRGEDVDEDEMTDVARAVAYSLQDAVDTMREMVGPEHQAEVEARMMAEMTDEEFEEWSRNYPIRQALRMARDQERIEAADA